MHLTLCRIKIPDEFLSSDMIDTKTIQMSIWYCTCESRLPLSAFKQSFYETTCLTKIMFNHFYLSFSFSSYNLNYYRIISDEVA